jgi:hypothetical protein
MKSIQCRRAKSTKPLDVTIPKVLNIEEKKKGYSHHMKRNIKGLFLPKIISRTI